LPVRFQNAGNEERFTSRGRRGFGLRHRGRFREVRVYAFRQIGWRFVKGALRQGETQNRTADPFSCLSGFRQWLADRSATDAGSGDLELLLKEPATVVDKRRLLPRRATLRTAASRPCSSVDTASGGCGGPVAGAIAPCDRKAPAARIAREIPTSRGSGQPS